MRKPPTAPARRYARDVAAHNYCRDLERDTVEDLLAEAFEAGRAYADKTAGPRPGTVTVR